MADSHPARRRPRNWRSFTGSLQERASVALSRLEDITRLVSEWVWETDDEGCLTYVSERTNEKLGYHQVELVGKKLTDLGTFLGLPDGQDEPDWRNPFRDIEFIAQHSDGEDRLFKISGLPVFNPESWKFEGVCGIAEDITDERKRETDLKDALAKVKLADRAKTDFLANTSHELRTPLNAILGFSEAMQSDLLGTMDEATVKTYAGHIRQAGTQLLKLINDILDVASIEEQNLNLKCRSLNIDEVFASVQTMLGHRAAEGQIDLRFALEKDVPVVWGDELRIKQIVLNLVTNAIKFTPPGGKVTCTAAKSAGSGVKLTVIDTGIGMEPDEIKMAMLPFAQVESSFSRKNDGTGLGVPLTMGLVEAHGGSFSIDSVKGSGTTVTVILPSSGN